LAKEIPAVSCWDFSVFFSKHITRSRLPSLPSQV
jgi:hypothetical protein